VYDLFVNGVDWRIILIMLKLMLNAYCVSVELEWREVQDAIGLR